ncbi:MAG: hypothetical protein PHQ86_04050 [Dehalococcoidales bacterium]|nr:hypothetical protein [Dehalococcoidales bacterium]
MENTEIITARNLVSILTEGAAVHREQSRKLAEILLKICKGETQDYQIRNRQKLLQVAQDWDIPIKNRNDLEIANDIGQTALAEFDKENNELLSLKKAPLKRQELWQRGNIKLKQQSNTDTLQDYRNLLRQGAEIAIADGWGSSMIANDIHDIIFNTPTPSLEKIKPDTPEQGEVNYISGFSHESIHYSLGGSFRASYRPLNDNIINGRIRGVAGVVGCNDTPIKHQSNYVSMVKELIKNDVLVLATGSSATACAKAGLMIPEAIEYAGDGLASVCEAIGIPPVLHLGSCIDNSRILIIAAAIVKEGGLGDDISDLPIAGAAPEEINKEILSIGQYFVSSGVFTISGVSQAALGSEKIAEFLAEDSRNIYGGMWAFEPDPTKAAKLIINHIDQKRKALGIDKTRERILYDMEMRRGLETV